MAKRYHQHSIYSQATRAEAYCHAVPSTNRLLLPLLDTDVYLYCVGTDHLFCPRTIYFAPGPSGEFEKVRFLRVVILIAGCNVCDPALYAFCGKSFRNGFLYNTGHFSKGSKNDRFSKKDRLPTKKENPPPKRGSIATITTLDL